METNSNQSALGHPIECDSSVNDVEAAYQEHSPALLRFLTGILHDEAAAADATQWTFVQLMEKGQDIPPESIKSWLFRVAFNYAMNVRRRKSMEQRSSQKFVVWRQQSGRDASGSAGIEDDEILEKLYRTINELPDNQREIVQLRIAEEKKFVEIAEALNIPLGTVLTRMRAALATLKRKLNRDIE